MSSFDLTNTANRLQSIVGQQSRNLQQNSIWMQRESNRHIQCMGTLMWNECLQKWIGQVNLAPTQSSRVLYLFHMWLYQMYLWIVKQQTHKVILPTWMNTSSWVSFPSNLLPHLNLVHLAAKHLLLHIFSSASSDLLNEIEQICLFISDPNIVPSEQQTEWIKEITDAYIQVISNDYSGAAVNPTYPSPYQPTGDWIPLKVPNGSYLNEWSIPWVKDDDSSTYKTQQFATPQWGGVRGYEWYRGPNQSLPLQVQNILQPYLSILDNPAEQMQDVLTINQTLTSRMKAIAEFWEDGAFTAKPCGKWNWIARCLAYAQGYSEEQNLELFFGLNACMANAFIVAWDVKRIYQGERPITYLRRVTQEQGTVFQGWRGATEGTGPIDPTQEEQGFLPYQSPTFLTPPFPGFISGHATCSSAAATYLEWFTGSPKMGTLHIQVLKQDQMNTKQGSMNPFGFFVFDHSAIQYDTPSHIQFDQILSWPTWQDAAKEASMSRLYGGIHIDADNKAGLEVGAYLAKQTIQQIQAKQSS
jgi:hypothetical protein